MENLWKLLPLGIAIVGIAITLWSEQRELSYSLNEHKIKCEKTNDKQWEFINSDHEVVIRLDERVKFIEDEECRKK